VQEREGKDPAYFGDEYDAMYRQLRKHLDPRLDLVSELVVVDILD
jgi:hypothetical protein